MTNIGRISSSSQGLQNMDSVANMQKRMAQLQEQVSSGKAIQRASDNPGGTQSVLTLRAETARTSQYTKNIDNGLLRLNAARTQVDSINDQLMKVRELVIQGQSSATPANVRSALAAQVDVLRSSLLVAANGDYAGRPLFAGSASVASAYDASGNYLGDASPMTTRVDDSGSTVRIDVNGPEIFGTGASNAFALLTTISSSLRNTPADLAANLDSLDSVISTARGAQATVLSRVNQLNELHEVTADRELGLAGALNAVENTDLGKAVMELTVQQTGYQAALYATAKVMQPSLMDFLR